MNSQIFCPPKGRHFFISLSALVHGFLGLGFEFGLAHAVVGWETFAGLVLLLHLFAVKGPRVRCISKML